MSIPVPNRSARGCLTCKQRKKKCDETKPACERCTTGNFQCLGYSHLDSLKSSTPRRWQPRPSQRATDTRLSSGSNSNQDTQSTESSPDLGHSLDILDLASRNNDTLIQPQEYLPLVAQLYERPLYIPRSVEQDPLEVENMVQVIVSQYGRLANRVQFRPFQFSIEKALAQRAMSSSLVRSTMYLGARIAQALLDDTNSQGYVGWINSFHRRIVGSEIVAMKQGTADIANRLAALQDLAFYTFMVLNSSSGYALFRKCIPLFLQLVARYPQVWADHSAISIHRALHAPRHEIIKFVFMDTIASLAFGVIPLIHYDTTLPTPLADSKSDRDIFIEWVYACAPILIALIARINSSRISRVTDQRSTTTNEVQMKQIEEALREWKPRIDYDDEPSNLIARMAIQECWRQSALIYLYMGMCGANSADERVQRLVKQVVQLATTVEAGSQLETHLFIPCLIVGAAARKEKHRSVARRKVQASRNAGACLLRGADFAPVLDHLWHGAAAGGVPTTWEDYVDSRCATLPVEI